MDTTKVFGQLGNNIYYCDNNNYHCKPIKHYIRRLCRCHALIQMENEVARIRDLLKEHPKGMTIEEISRLLPLNRTSTAKYLNTLLISGQADMRTYGRAKVFSLIQRVPLSNLMSLSSELILILDREHSISYVNSQFLQVFHLKKQDLIGKKIEQTHVTHYLSPHILDMMNSAFEGKESVGEQHIKIKDLDYYFISKLIPMVFDNGNGGLAIILEDITQLKEYQLHLENIVEERTREIIKTNENLEREIADHEIARKALGVVNDKLNLLASVTRHDILNQITAISGYLQLLDNECSSNPKVSPYIQNIKNAIITLQRQITFTRDYKDLGLKSPEWQRMDDVIQRAAALHPLPDVNLIIGTADLEIFADPFLEKVFINIFDYTLLHGEKVTEIKVTFHEHREGGILMIADNGIGIPVSLKERIFEYSGKDAGSNLFLSREILSITGLSISENGEQGQGARFEIHVPAVAWRQGDNSD
jgi:PAS domain S-box-containing protein